MEDQVLLKACMAQKWDEVLTRLREIELGADDLGSFYGNAAQSIVHILAANGQLEALTLLFEKTAVDVNVRDGRGRTPLHLAAEFRHLEVVKFLVNKGADVNAEDKFHKTPLLAINADRESRGKFIGAAANITVGNDDPNEIIRFLWANGANIDAQNRNGETVMHHAASGGNAGLTNLLLNTGANAELMNKEGDTPLHGAIEELRAGTAQMLLQRTQSGRIANGAGVTPLQMLASDQRFGHGIALQSATSMLEKGPNKGVRQASRRANEVMANMEIEPQAWCCLTNWLQKLYKMAIGRQD